MRFSWEKMVKFTATGAVGTLLHYAVLFLLVNEYAFTPGIAAMLGGVCGALFNYFVNRKYTFDSNVSHVIALPKYAVMSLASVLISGLIVSISTTYGIHYIAGQLVATSISLIFNYLVSNRLIFRK